MRNYTKRIMKNKINKTKKNKTIISPYIPFEREYIKTLLKNKKLINIKKDNIKLMKDISLKYSLETKESPKNDFYTYINGRWLKNKDLYNVQLNEGQKYIAEVDNFRLVQDNVFGELDIIIKEYIKHNDTKKSHSMKNFYESVKLKMPIQTSLKYIKNMINYIDEMRKDKKNIWKILAEINKNETSKSQAPFIWNVVTNKKKSTHSISEISPHIFVILNMDAYYKNNEDRQKFNNYIKKLFETANVTVDNYEDVINVNIDLFNSFVCSDLKQNENGYNLVQKDEALEKYGFDWKTFATELGYKHVPKEFVVTDLNYFKCCTKLMVNNWDSEKWRPWWIWLFIRKLVAHTQHWENIFLNYYGKLQRGVDIEEFKIRSALFTSFAFNTTVTDEYVKIHYNEDKVKYIKGFAEDLKYVFTRIITNNSWMSKSTRDYALLKLKHLKFDLVRPDKLFPDAVLDYTNNDFWGNLTLLMAYRTNLYISLDGKPIRKIPTLDWNQYPPKLSAFQSYIVNAMYIPTSNSIYIPFGYIQEPFIDLGNRGIEYNLSNIGFTICHEMSHCLDDSGSKYDYKGNLHNWWTPSDTKKYKKIQENILKQYSTWTKRDGVNYDASLSLGEDLADISAMYICEMYLLDFMRRNKAIIPVISDSINTFHVYFASQQKQKVSKLAEKAQLTTNPHPPNKYRCNIPLSRSYAFRSNYELKRGDDMWWHVSDPIW